MENVGFESDSKGNMIAVIIGLVVMAVLVVILLI